MFIFIDKGLLYYLQIVLYPLCQLIHLQNIE
ncbi:hypothetical protein Runsl_1992 [Runella slithyformis DSM 19594]|uniref:Uncharacterized protein n=1 Tax=Runella slithyformis (strain ATCC 29530 / DSM 19594 / LMG 11500 / NCIMB 11436 / LSU 4) TaxID=761193 RepID=A0A7U3ZJK4_RUNSL|nr:hypothetical protein Runsl_1992 [Runella slithyformis DSM 19594]